MFIRVRDTNCLLIYVLFYLSQKFLLHSERLHLMRNAIYYYCQILGLLLTQLFTKIR